MLKIFWGRVLQILTDIQRSLSAWRAIVRIIISKTFKIILNPSFVMFSIIAIAVGSMGVWLPIVWPGLGSPPTTNPSAATASLFSQLNVISVFTFCVAMLGSIAADFIFEEEPILRGGGGLSDQELEKILSKHSAFFLWFVAMITSFVCLSDPELIKFALGMTVCLWMYVNIEKDKFDRINKAAKDLLNLDLENDDLDDNGQGLKGAGL